MSFGWLYVKNYKNLKHLKGFFKFWGAMATAPPPLVSPVGRSLNQLKKLIYFVVIVCLHERESKMENRMILQIKIEMELK